MFGLGGGPGRGANKINKNTLPASSADSPKREREKCCFITRGVIGEQIASSGGDGRGAEGEEERCEHLSADDARHFRGDACGSLTELATFFIASAADARGEGEGRGG